MKKNVASQVVGCQLVSAAAGAAVTAGTTTVYVTIDGGVQATGSVGSGAATHEGQGFWTYTPSQAETNGDHLAFTFTNASAIPATVQVWPSFPQTGDNYARLGAPAGASIAADIAANASYVDTEVASILAAVDTEVAAIKAKTDSLTFTSAGKVDATIQAAGDFAQGAADKAWSTAARTLTAGTNIALAKGTGVTGFNDITAADVWASATRSLTDKAGFALSSAGVQAIWDALTSALTTVGSVGKLLVDNVNATISSRASQTSLDTVDDFVDTEVAAIKAKTDQLTFTVANQVDVNVLAISGDTTAADNLEAATDGTGYNVGNGSIVAASVTGAVASVTGNVGGNVGGNVTGSVGSIAAGGITAPSFGAGAFDAAALATDAANEIADAILNRNIAGGSSSGRLVKDCFRFLRNRKRIAAGTLTVYQEDDTASAWTAAVTTTAGNPISEVDPA